MYGRNLSRGENDNSDKGAVHLLIPWVIYTKTAEVLCLQCGSFLRLRSTWCLQCSWNHFTLVVYQMLNKDKWEAHTCSVCTSSIHLVVVVIHKYIWIEYDRTWPK